MYRHPFMVWGWAVVLIPLAGCSDFNWFSPFGLPTSITVTQAANGETLVLPMGGILTVKLASNPTTGYQWSILPGTDSDVLLYLDDSYTPALTAPGVAGSGGTESWVFSAIAPGTTTLNLVYIRNFEGITTSAGSFQLTVKVIPAEQNVVTTPLVQPIPNVNYSNPASDLINWSTSLFAQPQPTPAPIVLPTPTGG